MGEEFQVTKATSEHISQIKDVEELYMLITTLKKEDLEKFIVHYKEDTQLSSNSSPLVSKLIVSSKNTDDLYDTTKKELIVWLQEEEIKLKTQISQLRKKGKNVSVEDILLLQLRPQIKMFQATNNKSDFYKIKKSIDNISSLLSSLN